jgi:hypothetical protein
MADRMSCSAVAGRPPGTDSKYIKHAKIVLHKGKMTTKGMVKRSRCQLKESVLGPVSSRIPGLPDSEMKLSWMAFLPCLQNSHLPLGLEAALQCPSGLSSLPQAWVSGYTSQQQARHAGNWLWKETDVVDIGRKCCCVARCNELYSDADSIQTPSIDSTLLQRAKHKHNPARRVPGGRDSFLMKPGKEDYFIQCHHTTEMLSSIIYLC